MILKRLFENQDLLIERILIKEQKRLKLTNHQLLVLLAFFSLYKKPVFSLNALAKRVDLSNNEIGQVIDELIERELVSITLEQKDGKAREIFSLDQVFLELEQLYLNDQKNIEEAKYESTIAETIKLLEQGMGKVLSAYELESIRSWYEKGHYDHQQIINLIEQIAQSGRLSVKYIERLLNQQTVKQAPIDDKSDQVIDRIFKAIK